MAQYDLFADPAENGYLLDVQSDLLEGLNVRCSAAPKARYRAHCCQPVESCV